MTENSKIRESGLGPYNGYRVDEVPKLNREDLGMETWNSQLDRLKSALADYEGQYLFVSHALPIRVLTASFLGLNERESYGIDIKLASMTTIDVENEKVLSIGTVLLTERVKKLFSK